jgi:hypothetical protein
MDLSNKKSKTQFKKIWKWHILGIFKIINLNIIVLKKKFNFFRLQKDVLRNFMNILDEKQSKAMALGGGCGSWLSVWTL